MSLCYITIESHTYVILNLYIYTLTYAPKIFVVQCNRCDFSRTYSFVFEGVCMGLPMPCPPHLRTNAHTYGGGSLHMCSFNSLGSMSYLLQRIPCE